MTNIVRFERCSTCLCTQEECDCEEFASSFEPTPVDEAEARRLIEDGYKSTSSKHRSLARLPPGMTAIEAVRMQSPKAAADIEKRLERWAESEYMRLHAREEDRATVSPRVFRAFKKLGGEMA